MKRLLAVALAAFAVHAHAALLTLNWTLGGSGVATGIERCTGAGCSNFQNIGRTAPDIAAYQDQTPVVGTTYCYRVNHVDALGQPVSDYSNVACAAPSTAKITATPAAPAMTALAGTLPAPLNVVIATSNGVDWTSKDTCSFFDVSVQGGKNGATQTLTPNATATGWAALPVGTTACQITYSAQDAAPLVVTVTALKRVAAPANLKVAP